MGFVTLPTPAMVELKVKNGADAECTRFKIAHPAADIFACSHLVQGTPVILKRANHLFLIDIDYKTVPAFKVCYFTVR